MLPNHPRQTGSLVLDFEGLFLSLRQRHPNMQVQSSTVLEAPLMQSNSWIQKSCQEHFEQRFHLKKDFKPKLLIFQCHPTTSTRKKSIASKCSVDSANTSLHMKSTQRMMNKWKGYHESSTIDIEHNHWTI